MVIPGIGTIPATGAIMTNHALTDKQRDAVRARAIGLRQTEWLRDTYGITPRELDASPISTREEIAAAWVRYWRDACRNGALADEAIQATLALAARSTLISARHR
jgi:hypothetical protein